MRGEDGLDEVSPCGATRVTELAEDGTLTERLISPEDFALPRLDPAALAGGDAAENARAIAAILDGEPHPARAAIVLNAAAALVVAQGLTPRAAAARADAALTSRDAARLLARWRAAALAARAG